MDERQAIERLKRGDAGGLRVLVETHYDRAARAAYLVVRDPALAEDVAQGAFVRAYDKIGTFDARRPFAPWFMRLVVNDAVEVARRRERWRTLPLNSPSAEDLASRLADPASGPQELAEEAEERRRVWAALETLIPAQRAVIVQRYYLDMSEAEMAQSGSSPPGTIKWRLHAARKALSKLLRPETRSQGAPTIEDLWRRMRAWKVTLTSASSPCPTIPGTAGCGWAPGRIISWATGSSTRWRPRGGSCEP